MLREGTSCLIPAAETCRIYGHVLRRLRSCRQYMSPFEDASIIQGRKPFRRALLDVVSQRNAANGEAHLFFSSVAYLMKLMFNKVWTTSSSRSSSETNGSISFLARDVFESDRNRSTWTASSHNCEIELSKENF